jgi:histidinol dehydrogenase
MSSENNSFSSTKNKNDTDLSSISLLKFMDWSQSTPDEKNLALQRPKLNQNLDIQSKVFEILNQVKTNGDEALKSYTSKFDGVELEKFNVTQDEIANGYKKISTDLIESLKVAIENLTKFHKSQIKEDISISTMTGVTCEKRNLPIEKVGLYIPGGTAPLPSTLMMLAIPALIAGCDEIVLCTPPQKDGSISDVILATCSLLNINTIYKVGGAQAIAALAFGTKAIPKVDKIFGPGNAWVTEAKMQVAYNPEGAAIDLPAGPSEVLVIADAFSDAEFIASDLLSQAEHDKASQVILVTTSKELLNQVELELITQLELLPRKEIALAALASSRSILAPDLKTALMISNIYAPEHLILQVKDLALAKSLIKNAGSVFVGPWSPESVGDYASGTNHVLPTYGFAKAFSGVSLDSFMKSISFQELSMDGLKNLGPHVERLAEAEGLQAHKNAVSLRLNKIKNMKKSS